MRQRLTYSNVASSLALFLAVGGGAIAVASISNDSVKSRHIVNGAVKSQDIGKQKVKRKHLKLGAVATGKILDGTIRVEDISQGAQDALRGQQGPKGDPGPAGPPGPGGSGSVVQTIATNSGSQSSPPGPGAADIPLTGGSWTQTAEQLALVAGEFSVDGIPPTCNEEFTQGRLRVLLDGEVLAQRFFSGPQPQTLSIDAAGLGVPSSVFPTGAAESRTLTADVEDNCTNSDTVTVTDLQIFVLGFE